MKELPLGMNTFKELIEGGYVYADKTKYVYGLASRGKAYFLSRPRRFGKSLLLSTFEALFSGPVDPDGPPQGLFADLWIGRESNYDFTQQYPIITFSMGSTTKSSDELKLYLSTRLKDINDKERLNIDLTLPNIDLPRIIKGLSEKHGKQVVVLIDEYDAPVSNNIDRPGLALKNRDVLRDFYSGFKDTDKFLRFVFVTGVTRYAFMGLSAGLNHLNDLTMSPDFAAVCGFAPDDLGGCFGEHLPVVLDKLKAKKSMSAASTVADLKDLINKWYDGYSWDGKTNILNPLSILKCIEQARFSDFWVATQPSALFLSNLLAKNDHNPLVFLKDKFDKTSESSLGLAEVGELAPIPGLFQTGYLTVDQITEDSSGTSFSLKIPNWEIKNYSYTIFADNIFTFLNKNIINEDKSFYEAIKNHDSVKLTEIIGSVFAGLPFIHHEDDESCYHKVLYGYCRKIGRIVMPELPGAVGIPDLVVAFPDGMVAGIEIKSAVRKTPAGRERVLPKLATEALAAIKAKAYWQAHKGQAKELVKIGLGVTWRGRCLALMESEGGRLGK